MPRRGEKSWQYSFEPSEVLRQAEQPRRKPSGSPCAGPCNSRARKAQAALDAYAAEVAAWQGNPTGPPPEEPEVEVVSPWPGDPIFCARCTALIRHELKELDELACRRIAEADGHRRAPGGERVGGSRGTPSPSAPADDVDELASMLRGWESVARGKDSTPPRRGFLAREVTNCVDWLVAHFDEVIAAGYAPDFALEVRQWHKRLCTVEKAGTGRHHLPVPCPRCGEKSLETLDGAEFVECTNRNFGDHGGHCGRLLSREEADLETQAWLSRRGVPENPAA
jgi:hypothetical protein